MDQRKRLETGELTKAAVAGSSEEAHKYALKAIRYLQRDALITTADIESVRFYIQVRGDVRFAGKIIMLTFNDTEEKAVEKVRPVRQSAGQGTAKFFTLLLLLYLCPFPVS